MENDTVNVTGNKCNKGKEYAIREVTNPTRIVTSTVRVNGGERPVVAVKTQDEIPKKLIFEVMKEINKVTVNAPVNLGDIVIKNVLDTGVNVVATANIKIK
jgi:CxxC motif-containing protein